MSILLSTKYYTFVYIYAKNYKTFLQNYEKSQSMANVGNNEALTLK